MTTKVQVLIGLAVVLTSFAFGRYTAPEKVRIETKTVEVEKKVEHTDTNRDKHQDTTTTTEKRPDGTVITTTKTTVDTKTNRETDAATTASKSTDELKEITKTSSPVTLTLLGGAVLSSPQLVYGGMVGKPVLGPIGISVWALSNATLGAGVSLTF